MSRILNSLPFMVFGFWIVLFVQSTQFFSTITWEQARQYAIAQQQPNAAFLRVSDSQGRYTNLSDLAQRHQKAYIVEFVYTQCQSLCLVLGNTFQQVQSQIVKRGLTNQLGLVSVSFDIERDQPSALARYATRMHASPDVWTIATMADQSVLQKATQHLGLIILKNGRDYTHNSAYLVLSKKGHILGLFAVYDIDGAIELALKGKQAHESD